MNVKPLLIALLYATPALSQGFANLGASVDGFAVPELGYAFSFPADHGPHPDYRIEWWYLTASLRGADGTDYGVQWTLFRTALAPGEAPEWNSPQLWMGHAAVTTPNVHLFAERLARGGIGQAGVNADPFEAWIDDWQMVSQSVAGSDALSALNLTATADGFAYNLALTADGPLVAHGDQGYSVKSAAGQASYYYSQPFYTVGGQITVGDDVIPVTGQAWLDREWSSQPLAADQTGWDWFSLVFDSGARLMGFRLRDAGAGFTSATWIDPDGKTTPMPPGALLLTPLRTETVAGREIPVEWQVALAAKSVDVTVSAINSQAFMDTTVPYWEGPIRITGTHGGRGYLEMTGYK
jgi:predicted secreted hydrolase